MTFTLFDVIRMNTVAKLVIAFVVIATIFAVISIISHLKHGNWNKGDTGILCAVIAVYFLGLWSIDFERRGCESEYNDIVSHNNSTVYNEVQLYENYKLVREPGHYIIDGSGMTKELYISLKINGDNVYDIVTSKVDAPDIK